jgi:hypothetical protein
MLLLPTTNRHLKYVKVTCNAMNSYKPQLYILHRFFRLPSKKENAEMDSDYHDFKVFSTS